MMTWEEYSAWRAAEVTRAARVGDWDPLLEYLRDDWEIAGQGGSCSGGTEFKVKPRTVYNASRNMQRR